jgi:gas vesicle protein
VTLSEFTDNLKHEALKARDAFAQEAKSTIRSTAQGWVDDLKAKAAANPMAALAIGAGLGWRFLHRPPIATVLIGAGLLSLLRTPATHLNLDGQAEHLAYAKERLKEQAGQVVEKVGELASETAETVKEQAGELSGAVKEQLGNLSPENPDMLEEVKQRSGEVVERAAAIAGQVSSTVQGVLDDEEVRDKLLLGVAGMAIAAAVGLAYQRRVEERASPI